MGRKSKSEKAIEKFAKIEKTSGYFTISIRKQDDTVVFSNKKISKIDLTKIYLKNLKANISKHPEYNAKEILQAYHNLWSKYKIISVYTDSYGHKWTKNAFLSDTWLITYINNVLENK